MSKRFSRNINPLCLILIALLAISCSSAKSHLADEYPVTEEPAEHNNVSLKTQPIQAVEPPSQDTGLEKAAEEAGDAEAEAEHNNVSLKTQPIQAMEPPSQDTGLEKAAEEAAEAEVEAKQAKKEEEIQQKSLKLEKKKAEAKLKEAELAKKDAELARESAESEDKIVASVKQAKLKEEEAAFAQQQVTIAEEKMRAAQDRARLSEEELGLARERATVAEAKIRKKQSEVYKKIIQTGLILLIGYLLFFILGMIINRRVKELKTQHILRKNALYLINLIIILYIIFLWFRNISSLTIFFSAAVAGAFIALQDVILSIAGWFVIHIRRPFEVGDRIELGGVKGDVIDIRLLQTVLLEIGNWVEGDQSTGRIVNVPNSAIFKQENYNYNRGFEFIWNEIKVLITFESDWKRAEEIMLEHALKRSEGMEDMVRIKIKRMARRYMIHYGKLTPIVYVDIKDSGVGLTLRYLTKARARRTGQDELSRVILEDFEKEERVNFAYPTYRIVK